MPQDPEDGKDDNSNDQQKKTKKTTDNGTKELEMYVTTSDIFVIHYNNNEYFYNNNEYIYNNDEYIIIVPKHCNNE